MMFTFSIADVPFALSIMGVASLTLITVLILQNKRYRLNSERMETLADTDALTKLSNRRCLEALIPKLFAQANRDASNIFAILIDIDHFKRLNDSYGHLVGDEVLKHFAQSLLSVCRKNDYVFRLGGEEFLTLSVTSSSEEGAIAMAEKVRSHIESQPLATGGHDLRVTVSCGVSCYHGELKEFIDNDWQTLYARLDSALYQAKHSGRNRVVFNPTDADVRSLMQVDDLLTGLSSREFLFEKFKSFRETEPREYFAVAIGLRRFKEVNVNFGYQAGNDILRQIGERIRLSSKGSVVAARLGGDVFGVVYPADAIDDVSLRLQLETIGRPYWFVDSSSRNVPVMIDPVAGISRFPEHGNDSEELFKKAEIAMYSAQKKGESFCAYTAAHAPYSDSQMMVLTELRHSILSDHLILHYQPKFDLVRGVIYGAEALIRWAHPERGLVMPDDFISVAEQYGHSLPLTLWVLETAAAQMRSWMDQGIILDLSVNICATDLKHASLPATIYNILQEWRIPPERLTIEITESATLADHASAKVLLDQVRSYGVKISIDDFGTGYSSFAHLRNLPIDEIKIDKSFVHDVAVNPKDSLIISTTISIGTQMSVAIVAEGVETAEIAEVLKSMGVRNVQGYWIGRPMEPDVLAELVLRRNSGLRSVAATG